MQHLVDDGKGMTIYKFPGVQFYVGARRSFGYHQRHHASRKLLRTATVAEKYWEYGLNSLKVNYIQKT